MTLLITAQVLCSHHSQPKAELGEFANIRFLEVSTLPLDHMAVFSTGGCTAVVGRARAKDERDPHLSNSGCFCVWCWTLTQIKLITLLVSGSLNPLNGWTHQKNITGPLTPLRQFSIWARCCLPATYGTTSFTEIFVAVTVRHPGGMLAIPVEWTSIGGMPGSLPPHFQETRKGRAV